MICAECGSEMRLTSEPLTEKFRGVDITVNGIKRWQCDHCGDNVMDVDVAEKFARAQIEEYAHMMGTLSPSEIFDLRKSLGLKQKDFEKLLGVSSPTVSRWESGAVQQSKPVDNLMRLIRDVPEARRYMLEKAGSAYKPEEYGSTLKKPLPSRSDKRSTLFTIISSPIYKKNNETRYSSPLAVEEA